MKDPAVIAQSEHAPTPPSAPGGGASPAKRALVYGVMLAVKLSLFMFVVKLVEFIIDYPGELSFGSLAAAIYSDPDPIFYEDLLVIILMLTLSSAIPTYLCFKFPLRKSAEQEREDREDDKIENFFFTCVMVSLFFTTTLVMLAITYGAGHLLIDWVDGKWWGVGFVIGSFTMLISFILMALTYKRFL